MHDDEVRVLSVPLRALEIPWKTPWSQPGEYVRCLPIYPLDAWIDGLHGLDERGRIGPVGRG